MRRSTCWIAAIALAAASAPAGANDLVRVAGEIQPEGGVDIGDVVAGLRAIAGFRVLTDAEKLTANVYPCVPVDLGGADPSPHPPPCTPTPGFLFDLNDVGVILDAWRGALYIAPTRGYQQQKAGTLNGTSSEALFLGGTERPDVTFADYDGDGDLELLSIGAENAMRWWRNPGVTSPDLLEWDGFLPFSNGTTHQAIAAATLVDLDEDGDLDLVGGVGRFFPFCRFEGLDASMRPRFASPANLLDADTLGNLGANGGSARPAIADFTGDGHPDILAGHSLGLDFFVNQGDAAPGTPATFANLGQATPLDLAGGGRISVEFVAPAARDFDGDTLADLLAAAGDTVYYFHHQGTFDPDGFPEFADGVAVIGPAAQAEISGIALGDFDGDGKVDAVTASSAPPVYVFHQGVDAAPSFEAGVAFEPGDAIFDRGGASVVATGDIVGDDSEDLVVTADDATFEIYETTGVGDAPSLSGPTPLSLQVMGADARGRPIFLDLDGDANVDILFAEAGTGPGDAGPRILSFEQTTTAPPGFTFVDYLTDGGTIQVPGSHLHLAAGDVTGDGALDLVAITEGDAFALQVWILAHEDGAGLDPFRDAWAAPVAAEVLGASQDVLAHALADPDFDGDLDIVGWSRRGGLHLMLNIGTPTAPRFTRPIRFLPPSGDLPNRGGGGGLAALDLGGDGDLDWLIGQGDGGLVLWRSVQAD